MSAPIQKRRTYTAADLPALRAAREAYRDLLRNAERERSMARNVAGSIAASAVVDELRAKFHAVGVLLTRLEQVPPRQRVRFPALDGHGRVTSMAKALRESVATAEGAA